MRKDPNWREPRWPTVLIWTLTGLLVGFAGAIVLSLYILAPVVGAGCGLMYGLWASRRRASPDED